MDNGNILRLLGRFLPVISIMDAYSHYGWWLLFSVSHFSVVVLFLSFVMNTYGGKSTKLDVMCCHYQTHVSIGILMHLAPSWSLSSSSAWCGPLLLLLCLPAVPDQLVLCLKFEHHIHKDVPRPGPRFWLL